MTSDHLSLQKRFQNDEHIYKAFLDILNMYRKEHKDINEVYNEVNKLLQRKPGCHDVLLASRFWFLF